jgi:hypothetical protein
MIHADLSSAVAAERRATMLSEASRSRLRAVARHTRRSRVGAVATTAAAGRRPWRLRWRPVRRRDATAAAP